MRGQFIIKTSFEERDWDLLVQTIPWATAQHCFGYARALDESFRFLQPCYSLFYAEGTPVAGLPLFRFAPIRPFHALYSLPFDMYGGPLIRPDYLDDSQLFNAIGQQIKEEAEAFDAFEAGFAMPPGYPAKCVDQIFGSSGAEVRTRVCPVLNLDRDLEEITTDFKPAVRRAIARCQRSGISIDVDPSIDEVRSAYPIYERRMKALGATAKPWDFVERLAGEGLAKSFVAKSGGQPAGLVILLVAGNFAVYWLSAIDAATTGFRTTNGLINAAIRWLHARNVSYFSLGESHGMGPGIMRFKMGWGPEVHHSTFATYAFRPRMQRIWRSFEPTSRKAYALGRKALGHLQNSSGRLAIRSLSPHNKVDTEQ
jgi:hypothetical protein